MKKQFVIKPITNKKEFAAANKMIEELLGCRKNSEEEKFLEAVTILASEYEKKHFPMPKVDPVEAIKFRMEQMGLKQKDLARFVGGENRASEILNNKRGLTLSIIKSLNKNLKIPAEILIT